MTRTLTDELRALSAAEATEAERLGHTAIHWSHAHWTDHAGAIASKAARHARAALALEAAAARLDALERVAKCTRWAAQGGFTASGRRGVIDALASLDEAATDEAPREGDPNG